MSHPDQVHDTGDLCSAPWGRRSNHLEAMVRAAQPLPSFLLPQGQS